jgi:biotin carboxylase
VALPSFESYARAHSKVGFSRLASELNLPQPTTQFVATAEELHLIETLPCVLKGAVGTASRSIWLINNRKDLQAAIYELERNSAFAEPVLVQKLEPGYIEHAQAIFCNGTLIGFHGYRQLSRGAGGGDATKISLLRPKVRSHTARLGEHLQWHGALSLDYIWQGDIPLYIDCNPRLVEPMSAFLAGLDLTDLLLRVSRGEEVPSADSSHQGVRTHSALQVLLGCDPRSTQIESAARMLVTIDAPRRL